MEKERGHMTERILNLTLEIVYLLTGENYIAFKLSDGLVASSVMKTQSPVTEPPSHSLKRNKKVEEVTSEIIELLTEEVSLGGQDVTERQYLEGHKDLYKDVMMEKRPPLTSADRPRSRNTSERCPRPLYSRDSTQEHQEIPQDGPQYSRHFTQEQHKVPQDDQVTLNINQIGCKTEVKEEAEESYVMDDETCKEEEMPPEISTDGRYRRFDKEECTASSNSENNPVSPNVRPAPSSTDLSTPRGNIIELSVPITHHTRAEAFPSGYDACFTQKGQHDSNQKNHSQEKPYSCPECGKCFAWKSSLITHEKLHKGEKPFVCSECGKCYPWRAFLLKHQRTHSAEKPFLCSECGKRFSEIFLLLRHQKTHTGDKPFSCSECGKCFSQKSDFERHLRTHTGERPYLCSECNKSFSQKEQLITHQRSHTGVMPYLCTECGKCFSLRARLIIHQRTHTGENPYSCSMCGKGFKTKSNLARHEKVHTGDRPYLCSECGKGFTDKSDLSRHERVHTGAQPYSCSECGKRFLYRSTMVSHLNIHKIEKVPTLAGDN